jgi:hypothetical protein
VCPIFPDDSEKALGPKTQPLSLSFPMAMAVIILRDEQWPLIQFALASFQPLFQAFFVECLAFCIVCEKALQFIYYFERN